MGNRDEPEDAREATLPFHDSPSDALEDPALVKAIREGQETELAEREEVFRILEGEE